MQPSNPSDHEAAALSASMPMVNAGIEAEKPLLVEFAELWSRGLADEEKLWQLFDVCEMYMYRPDYFGAPVFQNGSVLMTPVFSAEDLLTEFVAASPALGIESGAEGFDWVRVTGVQLFGLPIRARYLGIDLGLEHGVVLDLAARQDPPPLANNAPPFGINLEVDPDGNMLNGYPNLREDVY